MATDMTSCFLGAQIQTMPSLEGTGARIGHPRFSRRGSYGRLLKAPCQSVIRIWVCARGMRRRFLLCLGCAQGGMRCSFLLVARLYDGREGFPEDVWVSAFARSYR